MTFTVKSLCAGKNTKFGVTSGGDDGLSASDMELVQRVLEGDLPAYDHLVLRHRKVVLNLAHSLLGDWDEAEDVAQQAFLESLAGLRGLRNARKFRAWLLTITRRCAAHQHRNPQMEQIEHLSEVIQWTDPHIDSIEDDLRDRVRTSLNELTFRNRKVLMLHYLDGYTCKEIGNQMGIPAGTVKRILYESRNRLKLSLGDEKGWKQRMETKAKIDSTIKGPRHLVWWMLGDGAPWHMLGGLLRQSIYLAINKKALNSEQLSQAVDANPGYVHEAIEQLFREELIVSMPNGRYRTNFIAFGGDDWSLVSARIHEYALKFADALAPHLQALEDAWNRTTLPAHGFPWQKGIWPLCGFFVCAVGLSRHEPAIPVATRRDSGYRYWIAGYEYGLKEDRLWTAEIHSQQFREIGVGCFAARGLDNKGFMFAEDQTKILAALAKGAKSIESIATTTELSLNQVRQICAEMVQMGALNRNSNGLSLNFPFVGKEDDDILFPVVDKIAESLTRDQVTVATKELLQQLKPLGYGHLKEQFPVWILWFRYLVVGEGLRELVRRGILPDPTSAFPTAFSTVGWTNSGRLIALPDSGW